MRRSVVHSTAPVPLWSLVVRECVATFNALVITRAAGVFRQLRFMATDFAGHARFLFKLCRLRFRFRLRRRRRRLALRPSSLPLCRVVLRTRF